ncbi:hypothetical protein FDECE_17360 [Fusarium decemcellulare]|nr:hypothetical protein FDECE_17360 [Fusarium decemcellulare]
MPRLSFISQRRLGLVAKTGAGISITGAGGFYLRTRKCYFEPYGPELNEPLFTHPMLKQINPWNKPASFDSCVREVPFDSLDDGLVEDAKQGGTKLIERFAEGMWGGYGYAIQRRIMEFFKDETCKDDVWTREDLLKSRYDPGTFFTNHFVVLEKTPTCITMRGCFNPHQDPPVPQDVDNMVELRAELDGKRRVVMLKLRAITFDGRQEAKDDPDPFGGVAGWLHKSPTRWLAEDARDEMRATVTVASSARFVDNIASKGPGREVKVVSSPAHRLGRGLSAPSPPLRFDGAVGVGGRVITAIPWKRVIPLYPKEHAGMHITFLDAQLVDDGKVDVTFLDGPVL